MTHRWVHEHPLISEWEEGDDREGRPVSVGSSEVTAMEHGGRALCHFTAVFSGFAGFTATKGRGSYGSLARRLWLERPNQQYSPTELTSDFPSLHFPDNL